MRPVSARPGHEVSEEERRYENGIRAQLLDIVEIPLEQEAPAGHQTENHLLAEDYYWKKQGNATWDQVTELEDAYDAAFWIDAESTYRGINDKVPENVAITRQNSLKLIVLRSLEIYVSKEAGFEGRPGRMRVRARFQYHSKQYLLSVTDPEIEEKYLAQGQGIYQIGKAALCISLAEIWNGYAFRVVASVIAPERCEA